MLLSSGPLISASAGQGWNKKPEFQQVPRRSLLTGLELRVDSHWAMAGRENVRE